MTNNDEIRPNERTIHLHDDMENKTMRDIIKKIIGINAYDDEQEKNLVKYQREPIKFYISTHGGWCDEAFNIISTIRSSKTPIHGYVNGYAYSCGFYAFIVCHKRFMGKYGQIMYHQSSGGTYGTMKSLEDYSDRGKREMKKFHNIVEEFTKIKKDTLKEYDSIHKDWFIESDEALKLGCCDQII